MRYPFIILLLSLVMCTNKNPSDNNNDSTSTMNKYIDVQGHRGCRGLMPENTLPAFQKALELGVNTLELDLVISQDEQVVVSHEPFFRAGIALTPDGELVTKKNEKEHNLFQMPYEQIKKYTLGTVPDKNHPNREDIATHKPLLKEVFQKAKDYAHTNQTNIPDFNIEIKRKIKHDGEFHPPVEHFVDLVLEEVQKSGLEDKIIIQSFDLESLRLVKRKKPKLRLALLIENMNSVEQNIQELGFTPDIYSCYHKLLNPEAIKYCQSKDIKVIPWTVNEQKDIDNTVLWYRIASASFKNSPSKGFA